MPGLVECSVSDGVCLLRLNAPPVNAITFALLAELRAAVRRASADADVRGVVITGSPSHFSAGADVNLFREIVTGDEAVRMSRVYQEALQEVEDCPKPVVAAVAGRMSGCAVELAAACHFRVCAAGTTFAMPEVTLGILPGAGATGRLPRLVGPDAALRMLLTAETLGTQEALRLGLVDEICDAAALLARAMALALSASSPRKTSERVEKLVDAAAAFARAEKLVAKGRPELIAPRKILEAVKAGIEESFDAALLKEQTGFAECMETLGTRNKVYLYFATRDTAKVPDLGGAEPADVRRAAVIGMGTMGTGIAQALIAGGIRVVARDEDEAALARGAERIRRSLLKRVELGKMSPDRAESTLGLLATTARWEEIADADLVVEAVFEDAATKRSVIAAVERACRADAVVATNTSTISLDVLAEGMRQPERFLGLHFFSPAHAMPLVEVIRRQGTSPRAVATALKLAKAIRKTPVVVRNREGFLVNRIFIPYLKEAFWLLEDGAQPTAIDAAMAAFGFPMGPLALIDMAGLDILVHSDAVLRRAFPRHGPLSGVVARLVDAGRLGQKAGSGVYNYAPGDYTPKPSDASAQAVADARRESGRTPREVGRDEITRRLVLRMVAEALWAMGEGIALREADLDAAMVLGTGFPDFRGGVLKYARDLGLDSVRAALEKLAEDVGERYAPPESPRER